MEYRNPGNATHHSKGMVFGTDSNVGVEIKGSSILSVSDSAASNLTIRAQGAGAVAIGDSSNTVFIGGSTTPLRLVSGESTFTPPPLSSFAQGECTFAAAGISTGDVVIAADFRNDLSTQYLPGAPYVGAAGKIHVPVSNCHASSVSGSTACVARWVYLKRT